MTRISDDEVRSATRARKFWLGGIATLLGLASILLINMILGSVSFTGINHSLSSSGPEAITIEWTRGLWTMRYTLEPDGIEVISEDNFSWESLTRGLRMSFFSTTYVHTLTGGCRIVYLRKSILDKFTEHCINTEPILSDAIADALMTGRNKIHEQAQVAETIFRKHQRALKNLPQD